VVIDEPPGIYITGDLLNDEDGRVYTQFGMVRLVRIVR